MQMMREESRVVMLSKRRTRKEYKLLLHNDDVTPIDVVIMVLCKTFDKSEGEAISIANSIDKTGSPACIYKSKSKEIVETLKKEAEDVSLFLTKMFIGKDCKLTLTIEEEEL